jgi:transposase, IS30 family
VYYPLRHLNVVWISGYATFSADCQHGATESHRDCGAEVVCHADITAIGLPVFFAHPHSSWERGTNENMNRIFREFFPKGVEITSDRNYLAMVASEMNGRPRKIHNWKSPSEIFAELVEANASTG